MIYEENKDYKPVPGSWYDRMRSDDTVAENNMPTWKGWIFIVIVEFVSAFIFYEAWKYILTGNW